MRKCFVFFLMLFLVFSVSPAYAINITAMDSAESLAQSLVGSGVSISNVSYTGNNISSGYFTDGKSSGIGIENGIVLTTGDASLVNGNSNTADDIGLRNNLPGDSNLDSLIPGYSTHDATVLQFDFVSSGDAVFFNYVFASEEYNEYVDSNYNDVFGFFVDGVNYALVPGSSTQVAINTVNDGLNSAYYNNNDRTDGIPTPYDFEYDGFTDLFMASITGLTAGETYNIKLAIADAGDYVLDSGVFLQAGSFSDTPDPNLTGTPEPSTLILMGFGALGLAGVSRKKMKK